MKILKPLLTVLLVLAIGLPTITLVWAQNPWTRETPLPTIRRDLGVVAVNGKIYAIGGRNDNGYLSINEEYDPSTKNWNTKTPMPTPRSDFGIAVVQNKIYCLGGIIDFDWSGSGRSILTGVNEVYDPFTDTWETKTSIPTKRQRPTANVVEDKIFVIGGNGLKINEVYDPETDSWTSKSQIPILSNGPASTTLDNQIYVISGYRSNLTQIYSPESDTWSQGAPIPTSVGLASATAISGEMTLKRIYVIGGYPSYDEVSLNQVYDPQTDTWIYGVQMPTARHSLGVAVTNDMLYAIGGGSTNLNKRVYNENEKYNPLQDPFVIPEFPSWIILPLFLTVTLVIVFFRKSFKKRVKSGNYI